MSSFMKICMSGFLHKVDENWSSGLLCHITAQKITVLFMKMYPVGADLLHVDGRHDEAISRSLHCANMPTN